MPSPTDRRIASNPVGRIILVRTLQVSLLGWAGHLLFGWPLMGPHALGLFLTPLLCAYFVFVFVGPWSWGLPIRTKLTGQERVVALTFDDGPSAEVTPRVLDLLQEYEAPATFFVLTGAAEAHPLLVRRLLSEGHRLGLHGGAHAPLVLPGWHAVRRELRMARAGLLALCPEADVVWLRPPYGFKTVALPFLARREGMRLCAWSVDGQDYQAATTPERVAANVLRRVRPGAIVLLHDGPENGVTAQALPLILDGLRRQGYRCVTLP